MVRGRGSEAQQRLEDHLEDYEVVRAPGQLVMAIEVALDHP